MIDEKSIAVLPFANLSADPENEYFSDGMTEEIINALSQIEHLKVTARTSSFVFKNQSIDIRTIGQELGVAMALEGSVRKSKDRLRITAQLIRTSDGFHIWSENFDRNLRDIFELQDEVSLLIADKIREYCGHLTIKDQLVKINTQNIEAYQLYLKGRYYYNQWDMPSFAQAAENFKQSIAEDADFDLPYFGIGLSYSFLGSWGGMDKKRAFELAEDYFTRGNQLEMRSAYSYYSVAKHQFWGYWNDLEAYKTLQKAYAMQPDDANTNEFMAEIHSLSGHFSTALKYTDTSLRIDPLAPSHYYTKANIFYLQGSYSKALKTIEKGLSLAPAFTIARELQILCLLQLEQWESYQSALITYETPVREALTLLYQLKQANQQSEFQTIQTSIKAIQRVKHPPLLPWDLYLTVYAGHTEEALQFLTQKVSDKMGQVIHFKYDPLLEPLHDLEAFQELVSNYFPDTSISTIDRQQKRVNLYLTAQEATHFTDLLLRKMKEEQYYLEVNLGLKELATKIGLHPNKLSWLLNEKIHKNFYEFINSFRLMDFQKRALDPKNQHLSLLGLAYESGFNSKSVFNDYFKKKTGLTPSAWLKEQLKS